MPDSMIRGRRRCKSVRTRQFLADQQQRDAGDPRCASAIPVITGDLESGATPSNTLAAMALNLIAAELGAGLTGIFVNQSLKLTTGSTAALVFDTLSRSGSVFSNLRGKSTIADRYRHHYWKPMSRLPVSTHSSCIREQTGMRGNPAFRCQSDELIAILGGETASVRQNRRRCSGAAGANWNWPMQTVAGTGCATRPCPLTGSLRCSGLAERSCEGGETEMTYSRQG